MTDEALNGDVAESPSCIFCNEEESVALDEHHIIPDSLNPSEDVETVKICSNCHRKLHDKLLDPVISYLKENSPHDLPEPTYDDTADVSAERELKRYRLWSFLVMKDPEQDSDQFKHQKIPFTSRGLPTKDEILDDTPFKYQIKGKQVFHRSTAIVEDLEWLKEYGCIETLDEGRLKPLRNPFQVGMD